MLHTYTCIYIYIYILYIYDRTGASPREQWMDRWIAAAHGPHSRAPRPCTPPGTPPPAGDRRRR